MHLSVDVGGTFIKYAWINDAGEIVNQGKEKTPMDTREHFNAVIKKIWSEKDNGTGISFSMPGTIDPNTGYIYQGGSLLYHFGVSFKDDMEAFLKVPVSIENDARCAALCEMEMGNMRGIDNGAVLTFGTGVGGCFIINHEIYRGTHLFSGEVSAIMTGDLKTDGLEAMVGYNLGMSRFTSNVSKLKNMPLQDGITVFKWIEEKDEAVLEAFEAFTDQIAKLIFNLQVIIDPRRVLIGGGVSENPIFVEGINASLKKLTSQFPIQMPMAEVMSCQYFNDANIWGAYIHFKNTRN